MVIDAKKVISKYNVAIKAQKPKQGKGNKKGEEEYVAEETRKGRKQRQAFAILFEEPEFRNVQPGTYISVASFPTVRSLHYSQAILGE
jgi:hypothetical protein